MGNVDRAPVSIRCFWCGEERNQKATLLTDFTLPAVHVIDGYGCCRKCKEKFSAGIHIIEVSPNPVGEWQAPMRGRNYPTGRSCVISESLFFRAVTVSDEQRQQLEDSKNLLLLTATYEKLLVFVENKINELEQFLQRNPAQHEKERERNHGKEKI